MLVIRLEKLVLGGNLMGTNLFNENLIKEKISQNFVIEKKDYEYKKEVVSKWAKRIEDGTLSFLKEEQLQGEFIRDFFCEVLGAKDFLNSENEWNVLREEKTKTDGTKADAVLGFFSNVKKDYRIAIELKGPRAILDLKQKRLGDNRTPVEQGFSYLPKYGKKCEWLIVSNYREIRLYNQKDASEYEVFNVIDLVDDYYFTKFLYLLKFDTLVSKDGKPEIENILEENLAKEKDIEKDFYKLYSDTRISLFNIILKNNSRVTPKFVLEKTQKLLDRFIFVCFAEDKNLIPQNIFHKVVLQGKNSFSQFGVWENVRGLFNSIDLGNPSKGINKFNGGLFKKDTELDELNIPNEAFDQLEEIASFDFNSDLNVNILGHIFEQSISDLEEIKASISGQDFDLQKGKRKLDGIFYTPRETTKYIVENTIGTYLYKKRIELGEEKLPRLSDDDLKITITKKGITKYSAKLNKHIKFWLDFRDIVSNIKVLDPACGSGAFLNEAFDYLYIVGNEINEILELYTGNASIFELDKTILENNIYGVDLNKESIEITKLSLWLKTANKNKELTTLDNNIICGNSLGQGSHENISAFSWEKEFENIMSNGGFDIILGNPPYVRNTSLKLVEKEYYSKAYLSANGQYDLYVLFNELAIKLIKKNGIVGFIQPNKFLSAEYGQRLLNIINDTCEFLKVKDVSQEKIFSGASVYPYIFIFKKLKEIAGKVGENNLNLFDICKVENLINFDEEIRSREIILKIENASETVSDIASYVKRGLPNTKANIIESAGYYAVKSTALKYPYSMPKELLNISYISKNYENEKVSEFNEHTIILPRTVRTIRAILNKEQIHILDRIYYFKLNQDLKYSEYQILAILNSKIISFYYNYKYGSTKIGGGYFDLKGTQIKELPIPNNLSNKVLKNIEKISIMNIAAYEFIAYTSTKFNSRVMMNFDLTKINNSLKEFYLMDFTDFIRELNKHKVQLSLKDQDEWEEYFNEKKEECKLTLKEIMDNEEKLNRILFTYYGIKESEIEIVEKIFSELQG